MKPLDLASPDDLRTLFAAKTAECFAAPLLDRFAVRAASPDEWAVEFPALRRAELPGGEPVHLAAVLSDAARTAALERVLGSAPLEHRLLFLDGDQIIGCYWGRQESGARYYMVSTTIRREHQGRGLYTAFLSRLLPLLESLGFREAYSRHRADNNAILVPKLKSGFLITALELSAEFGLLVHLRCPFSVPLRALYTRRAEAGAAAAATPTSNTSDAGPSPRRRDRMDDE